MTRDMTTTQVHITHEAWYMTTKSLHNIYFHNHWPTTTLGMQHTTTTQYTSYIIQTSIITGLQQHYRHAALRTATALATHNYTGLA